jgi:hypothetical protein
MSGPGSETETDTGRNASSGADESASRSSQFNERMVRVRHALAAACAPTTPNEVSERLLLVLSDVLAMQHPDGSWGSNDRTRQKPCCTAQTVTALYRLGIRYDRVGQAHQVALGPAESIRNAVTWLETAQRDDGSWGEDLWDTCQVLVALHLCGYTASLPCVQRGLELIRFHVDHHWPDRESYWFGPGFHGAAVELFSIYGDQRYLELSMRDLWEGWDQAAGCFRSAPEMAGTGRAPAGWHTATALIGLQASETVSHYSDRVRQGLDWLVDNQAPDGSWPLGYFEISGYGTLQAIVALSRSGFQEHHRAAARGTEWLVSRYGPDEPLTIRLVVAAAIARTHAESLQAHISFYWLKEIEGLLEGYQALAEELRQRCLALLNQASHSEERWQVANTKAQTLHDEFSLVNDQYQALMAQLERSRQSENELSRDLSRYALKLTGDQLAVWGLILTLVTFFVGILVTI